MRQRRNPLRGCEGILPRENLNIRLSEKAFVRFGGSLMSKQADKSELIDADIAQTFKL